MTKMTARPPAPATVFAASYLFAGVGALALVSAISALFAIPELSHSYSERAADGAAGTLTTLGLVLFAGCAVVFGALWLLLAGLDARGSGTARVLTWVLAALTICFNTTLLFLGVYDPVPWYRDLTRGLAVATLLFTAAAVALLAAPASIGYFRVVRLARPPRPAPPTAFHGPPGYPPPGYRPPGQMLPPSYRPPGQAVAPPPPGDQPPTPNHPGPPPHRPAYGPGPTQPVAHPPPAPLPAPPRAPEER